MPDELDEEYEWSAKKKQTKKVKRRKKERRRRNLMRCWINTLQAQHALALSLGKSVAAELEIHQ